MTAPAEKNAVGIDVPGVENIAQAIVDIATGMRQLNGTRLRRTTIVTLLHEASGVGKRDIERVLASMTTLEDKFLKPKSGK